MKTGDHEITAIQELGKIIRAVIPFAILVWVGTACWVYSSSVGISFLAALVASIAVASTLYCNPTKVRVFWKSFATTFVVAGGLAIALAVTYAGIWLAAALFSAILHFPFSHPWLFGTGLLLAFVILSEHFGTSDVPAERSAPKTKSNSGSNWNRTYADSGRRKLSTQERLSLWRDSDKRCFHCNKKLASASPRSMHVDHLVAFSKGGSCDDSNLVASCPRCNLRKGDKDDFDPSKRRKRRRRRQS